MSDLSDCRVLYPGMAQVSCGSIRDLAGCDIVAITAGIQTDSQDRLSLFDGNWRITEEIVSGMLNNGFRGILILITNPCDRLAWMAEKIAALGRERCFSTGTFLDTIRLKNQIASQTGMEPSQIDAWVIGEHGATSVVVWSQVRVGGCLLSDLSKMNASFQFDREGCEDSMRNAAWRAVAGKGIAEYGVAVCFARCVQAIFMDEKIIVPVSVLLQGEYGITDAFMGTPAVLGAGGVEKVFELPLTGEEKKRLAVSYETVYQRI